MNCPAGKYSDKTGAATSVDGCKSCEIGK